jgi:trehalose synthase
MSPKINVKDYEPIVGKSYIEELRMLASRLSSKTVLNINSTFVGGGVAEILSHLVPLFNQLGVDVKWQIISGEAQFFKVTKKSTMPSMVKRSLFRMKSSLYFWKQQKRT